MHRNFRLNSNISMHRKEQDTEELVLAMVLGTYWTLGKYILLLMGDTCNVHKRKTGRFYYM